MFCLPPFPGFATKLKLQGASFFTILSNSRGNNRQNAGFDNFVKNIALFRPIFATKRIITA